MDPYEIIKPSPERQLVADAGFLGVRRHIMHGLLEIDVTQARQMITALSEETGTRLSFTAFLVASLGRAVAADRRVQAYKDWRGRLVVFQDVDAVTLIEPQAGAVAFPHILRQVDQRSVIDLTAEIRSIQSNPDRSQQHGRLFKIAGRLPRFVRMLLYKAVKMSPQRFKRIQGTVLVTAVGMFGKGGGWGISFLASHTLGLTVGGIAQKPGVNSGQVEIRDYLSATLSFDHDIVDGAPAARFAKRLVEIIETGAVLAEKEAG